MALSINYARLFLTRPDYGYAGDGQDPRKGVVFPDDDGLWRVDLKTGEAKLIVGHCIYSPDGNFITSDGYWDEKFYRHWKIVRLADDKVKSVGDFFVPEPYRDVYCRCDLHPRWRPDGRQLGFNSVHEGSRQIYVIYVCR